MLNALLGFDVEVAAEEVLEDFSGSDLAASFIFFAVVVITADILVSPALDVVVTTGDLDVFVSSATTAVAFGLLSLLANLNGLEVAELFTLLSLESTEVAVVLIPALSEFPVIYSPNQPLDT